jgi:hypothetical protein
VTPLLIIGGLIALGALISGGIYVQYRRYRGKYEAIARAICDPGSWRVSFHLRTMLLAGKIGGYTFYYSIFGDERKKEPVNSHLLLEYPVQRNFRFYFGSDPELVDPEVRQGLAHIQEMPEFRGLLATSKETPFLARLIARPLGFGYRPGLLLWKWSSAPFDADVIRTDFEALLGLAKQGI